MAFQFNKHAQLPSARKTQKMVCALAITFKADITQPPQRCKWRIVVSSTRAATRVKSIHFHKITNVKKQAPLCFMAHAKIHHLQCVGHNLHKITTTAKHLARRIEYTVMLMRKRSNLLWSRKPRRKIQEIHRIVIKLYIWRCEGETVSLTTADLILKTATPSFNFTKTDKLTFWERLLPLCWISSSEVHLEARIILAWCQRRVLLNLQERISNQSSRRQFQVLTLLQYSNLLLQFNQALPNQRAFLRIYTSQLVRILLWH